MVTPVGQQGGNRLAWQFSAKSFAFVVVLRGSAATLRSPLQRPEAIVIVEGLLSNVVCLMEKSNEDVSVRVMALYKNRAKKGFLLLVAAKGQRLLDRILANTKKGGKCS